MSDETAVVERLIAAWEALDTQGVVACFAANGVWHNMPYAELQGHDKIAAAVSRFLGDTVECRFEIRHLAQIAPGLVITERVDIFRNANGPELRLPVMGIFEISDGLIQVWRDYFDSKPFNPA
jgi:limonene-1,2-epoxide hydrolase